MISFFANRGGSGEIRGWQMSEYLGAYLNPADGYERDVCIWVKRPPPDDHPESTYLDIVDAHERVGWLVRHEDVGVIASSVSGQRYLQEKLGRHVVYIPQHHCNIERAPHVKRDPLRLGVVGGKASAPPDDFGVTWWGKCRTREDVVSAYGQIDVQVIWRQTNRPLKNPLKIINAASFGIPTIAYPEPGYEEMEGWYVPAKTKEQVEESLEALRAGGIETVWNEGRLLEKAEEYHIDHIAQRYLEL